MEVPEEVCGNGVHGVQTFGICYWTQCRKCGGRGCDNRLGGHYWCWPSSIFLPRRGSLKSESELTPLRKRDRYSLVGGLTPAKGITLLASHQWRV